MRLRSDEIHQLAARFTADGKCTPPVAFGGGHINDTFLFTVREGGKTVRMVLQRINAVAFPKPMNVMSNMLRVTDYLRSQIVRSGGDPVRETLALSPTIEGEMHAVDRNGDVWRAYRYVEDAISYDNCADLSVFRAAGEAFGKFQRMLNGFDPSLLHETIANFHDTPKRMDALRQAVREDCAGRAGGVREEIDFALRYTQEASLLTDALAAGELPRRVTHNDTKLNNVLIDEKTRTGLCVIDLDTVMPGVSAYDFGDAIRFGANLAREDETDLSKVGLSLPLYRAFAQGYLSHAAAGMSEKEYWSLPVGAKLMTLECGVRFLTDYLNGDTYFKTAYPEHNLARARNQFALVRDMEHKWDEMCKIIGEIRKELEGKMSKKPILVIMAAGMGSRYGGLKQMDPIGPDGELILDYSLFDAKRAGFERAVIIIKRENEKDFREVLGDRVARHMQIDYAYQELTDLPEGFSLPEGRVKPWGTGHAVLSAAGMVDAPFCAINADDYYGADAFRLCYEHLKNLQSDSDFTMVGYLLKNTLSETGYVARGVCTLNEQNRLTDIVERTHIISTVDGPLMSEDLKTYTRLSSNTVVSMNMWGFPSAMMQRLKEAFPAFLEKAIAENPLKAEFFLPSVVDELLGREQAAVTVHTTHDRWYGVTYRADKPGVEAALRRMAFEGQYPTPLWQ